MRTSIEGQIVESHLDQEPESRRNGLEERLSDGPFARAKSVPVGLDPVASFLAETLHEGPYVPKRQCTDLSDILSSELDRERLRAKPLTLAGIARTSHEKASDLVVRDAALAEIGSSSSPGSNRASASMASRCCRRGTTPS